jgi:dTDP-glucose 4,6-dehydratase
LSGKTTIKLGNLDATRDMNYVKNTVDGFYEAGLHENSLGEILNLGSNREISIGDLVKLIGDIMNVELNIEIDENRLRPGKSEVERLLCSSEKVFELTGWEPGISLEEGLAKTVTWIKKNLKSYKPEIYNV